MPDPQAIVPVTQRERAKRVPLAPPPASPNHRRLPSSGTERIEGGGTGSSAKSASAAGNEL